jgi:hypothetical protein
VSFPDSLVIAIAEQTEGFSFAYLKEALYAFPAHTCVLVFSSNAVFLSVSSLVTLVTEKEDGHIITFEAVIKKQIKTLRKQLSEGSIRRGNGKLPAEISVFPRPRPQFPPENADISPAQAALERLALMSREATNKPGPIFPAPSPDIRGLLDDLQRNAGGSSSWL